MEIRTQDTINFSTYEGYEKFCNALERVFGDGIAITAEIGGVIHSANFTVDLSETFWEAIDGGV